MKMLMVASARFTWFPHFGKSKGSHKNLGAGWMHWLGWAFITTTEDFGLMMTGLISRSPDEIATLAEVYAKIKTMVSEEVVKETQYLRDSQSEQIAKRLNAENRCRVAEQKYAELVKSLEIVRQAGMSEPRCVVTKLGRDYLMERWQGVHLDDGK